MKSLEEQDIDITELEGIFILLPEVTHLEAVFYVTDVVDSEQRGFMILGIEFGISDNSIEEDMSFDNDWYNRNWSKMYFFEDSPNYEEYKRSMIHLIFEGDFV